MAAHVFHIGMDDCHRVEVLRSVGYRVDEFASLIHLATALDAAREADAVIVTESENIPPEKAIALARERSTVPLIFFRRTTHGAHEDEFDLVIQPLTEPEKWLNDVRSLVDWSRALRAQSEKLTDESRALRKETTALRLDSERERGRSVRERGRNSGSGASDAWQSPDSN